MPTNQDRTLTMSNKEANRISVLDRLNRKEIKQWQASEILELSTRQVKRLVKNYRQQGATGLIHGNRGRTSNRAIKQAEINLSLEIVKNKYTDFGPTLAHEKLVEANQVTFSVETLRKAMVSAGLWTDKRRRKVAVHQLRERRKCLGELVQIDGSPHRWFEDRGEPCTLLVFIDDATSRLLWLEFCHSETTMAYLKATKGYLSKYGKPLTFYSDRDSVFRINFKGGTVYEPTQFTRAMGELLIKVICATTPQAKGRVERANQTLQDRLVKELRLLSISDIREANKFLPKFVVKFNQKFGIIPASSFDNHRPLTAIEISSLDQILAIREERTLSKNLTCQFNGQVYQVQTKTSGYALRNARVKITTDTCNQIKMEYRGRKLDFMVFDSLLIPPAEIVGSKLVNSQVDTFVRKTIPNHSWNRFLER